MAVTGVIALLKGGQSAVHSHSFRPRAVLTAFHCFKLQVISLSFVLPLHLYKWSPSNYSILSVPSVSCGYPH
jgi:hypothetical protein